MREKRPCTSAPEIGTFTLPVGAEKSQETDEPANLTPKWAADDVTQGSIGKQAGKVEPINASQGSAEARLTASKAPRQ